MQFPALVGEKRIRQEGVVRGCTALDLGRVQSCPSDTIKSIHIRLVKQAFKRGPKWYIELFSYPFGQKGISHFRQISCLSHNYPKCRIQIPSMETSRDVPFEAVFW